MLYQVVTIMEDSTAVHTCEDMLSAKREYEIQCDIVDRVAARLAREHDAMTEEVYEDNCGVVSGVKLYGQAVSYGDSDEIKSIVVCFTYVNDFSTIL